MTTRHPSRHQGGSILHMLLVSGAIGMTSLGAYQTLAHDSSSPPPAVRQQQILAQAREALLARAATDDNRPGSLPCPDRLTDDAGLDNRPGDGKGDMLTRDRCPTAIGWLPWVTLDMPPPADAAQNTLWYVIAPAYYDDNNAMPINSNKPSGLTLAGRDEVAALLIAALAPLPGQQRPAQTVEAYLEGQLQEGATFDYQPGNSASNDRILAISRRELMAATEQRVNHSLRRCLSAHASSRQHFPWPAPLADPSRRGRQETRFGRVPLTQPSASIAAELQQNRTTLQAGSTQLAQASPAEIQPALTRLAEQARWSTNLLVSLEKVGREITLLGNKAESAAQKLQDTITNAVANDRIAVSEGDSIRSQLQAAIIAVDQLSDALFRYGIDALAWPEKPWPTPSGQATPSARDALLAARAELQQQAAAFFLLNDRQPRPTQNTLVAPVLAIDSPTAHIRQLSQQVSEHALAISTLASSLQAVAEQLQYSIDGNKQARDTVTNWLAKPDASNQQKMNAALAIVADHAARLDTALQQQAALSTSHAADAWPMVWASSHCHFLQAGSNWWNNNAWADVVMYQISDPQRIAHGDLQAGGRSNLALVVISAGPPLAQQARPALRVADLFEGTNADPSRDGLAQQPQRNFTHRPNDPGHNDQLAY